MFTFIIPSVRKATLEYAVESVISQTYPNWNAIVCGDGTPVPAFEDERVVSIIAPHRASASATRQYAIKYASEDWCVFLDDDDWIMPDYLEKFLPFLDNSDIIISRMMNYGWEIPRDNELIHGSVGISFAVRTEILRKYPMPPPPSEDYAYLVWMRDLGYRLSFTEYTGYYVRKYLTDPNYVSNI